MKPYYLRDGEQVDLSWLDKSDKDLTTGKSNSSTIEKAAKFIPTEDLRDLNLIETLYGPRKTVNVEYYGEDALDQTGSRQVRNDSRILESIQEEEIELPARNADETLENNTSTSLEFENSTEKEIEKMIIPIMNLSLISNVN